MRLQGGDTRKDGMMRENPCVFASRWMTLLGAAVVACGMCHGGSAHKVTGPIGTPIGEPMDLEGNPNLEGIAFDEKGTTLYVLDGGSDGGVIQVYEYDAARAVLAFVSSFPVPKADTGRCLTHGRGLATKEEDGRRILYTLSAHPDGVQDSKGKSGYDTELWRIDCTRPDQVTARVFDLNDASLDLRGAEVFDVACDGRGRICVSFDASRQAANLTEQRARGIVRFRLDDDRFEECAILPASGKTPGHHNLGLTLMTLDGHDYLLCSIEELTGNEDQEVYAADARTGRGLFKFPAPPMTGTSPTERRLAYGADVLWVSEQKEGLDQVRRVVIKDNLYEPRVGYKRPRRIEVTIVSNVVCPEGDDRGTITHNFGHPLANTIMPSQERYLDGHTVRMASPTHQDNADDSLLAGTKQLLTYSPMKDPSSMGTVTSVQYPRSKKNHGAFRSVFEEDF
jgi:hypothetical protein